MGTTQEERMMRTVDCRDPANSWPEGVSDGLATPCEQCGQYPRFDYIVDSEVWKQIVPYKWQPSVVCLPCFDLMAAMEGVDIGPYLDEVQFTGLKSTTTLSPAWTFIKEPPE